MTFNKYPSDQGRPFNKYGFLRSQISPRVPFKAFFDTRPEPLANATYAGSESRQSEVKSFREIAVVFDFCRFVETIVLNRQHAILLLENSHAFSEAGGLGFRLNSIRINHELRDFTTQVVVMLQPNVLRKSKKVKRLVSSKRVGNLVLLELLHYPVNGFVCEVFIVIAAAIAREILY